MWLWTALKEESSRNNLEYSARDIDYLLSTRAIRERTQQVFDLALKDQTHFSVHLDKLPEVADYVLKVIQNNYPDLNIPFHSRHGHLNSGFNRIQQLEDHLSQKTPLEKAKAKIDLVVVSVLLDAGAGDKWEYYEKQTQKTYTRSEGLAVASFHMFMAKCFSGTKGLQADVRGLKAVSKSSIELYFQVAAENPLIGIDGRVHLLNQLAQVIENFPKIFVNGRIGDMLDHLIELHSHTIKATAVLDFVLRVFGEIWPSRIRLGEYNLGDVWSYPNLGNSEDIKSLVPFHKLSQWLTYSLLVPMIEMGMTVTGVDELTGLAEYRNGGLLIDSGLIQLKDEKQSLLKHPPQSPLVIEWRALTVVLLDKIADQVRSKLNKTKEELPLARVLEGGTWHAGRKIAKEKRPTGEPPLNILSDGTVF